MKGAKGPRTIGERMSRFPDEAACVAFLRKLRWPRGFVCPRCDGQESVTIQTRRLEQCRSCRYQASLTAGTVFHRTRKPRRLWFVAIFGTSQDGHLGAPAPEGPGAGQLRDRLDLASQAALDPVRAAGVPAHRARRGRRDVPGGSERTRRPRAAPRSRAPRRRGGREPGRAGRGAAHGGGADGLASRPRALRPRRDRPSPREG